MTIEEFVERDNFIALDNVQTRLLNPEPERHGKVGTVDDAMFEIAMQNLQTIDRVGIAERLVDFLDLLRQEEGWTIPSMPEENRTQGRPATEDHAPLVLERIRELNRFDAQLFEAARERFEKDRAACASAGV